MVCWGEEASLTSGTSSWTVGTTSPTSVTNSPNPLRLCFVLVNEEQLMVFSDSRLHTSLLPLPRPPSAPFLPPLGYTRLPYCMLTVRCIDDAMAHRSGAHRPAVRLSNSMPARIATCPPTFKQRAEAGGQTLVRQQRCRIS